ncbi:MAG: hypothetical protein KatS3mg090_0439 [Patescibacteria group bacterium]|nr:MAG: hypothetical protein KatS3mg090_0439 [Patescibacteria group bacterium]
MSRKNDNNRLVLFLLFITIIFSIFIRVWKLDQVPAGFFADEASIGYNAYTILKTGKDEWGEKFPLFFRAFDEYKNPLDIYITTIPVAIFGLNEFSVRLTSVVFNILSIFIIFFIGREIKNSLYGFYASLFFAIAPWSIHLSRVNLEGQIYLFFFLVSYFFLIRFLKKKEIRFFYLSVLFLGITCYSYFSARVFAPIFFCLSFVFVLTKKRINLKTAIFATMIFIAIALPLVLHILKGEGMNRFYQVSMFGNPEIDPFQKFIKSYLLHFSPDYLFFKGDKDMEGQFISRHSVAGFGQFFKNQLPFIILGFVSLFKKRNYFFWLLILILIAYPVPSSITTDLPPQATRSIIGLIPFSFLTAEGFCWFLRKIKDKNFFLVRVFVIAVMLFSLYLYLKAYFYNYPLYASDFWGWQYGPQTDNELFFRK